MNVCPKVSVTIVTYNHGNMLAECLDSILSQVTPFSVEILVGEDASTDQISRKIAQKYFDLYPQRIRLFQRSVNVGACGNYFSIVQESQGEYIAHIDGDDKMLPGKLALQQNFSTSTKM